MKLASKSFIRHLAGFMSAVLLLNSINVITGENSDSNFKTPQDPYEMFLPR